MDSTEGKRELRRRTDETACDAPGGPGHGRAAWFGGTDPMDKNEIRAAYTEAAPWFDRAMAPMEWLGVGRLRRELLSRARGDVLEVAVGTGTSFRHYPEACRLVGGDLTRAMLERARAKADGEARTVHLAQMDVERLPVPDSRFDTVVDQLSLCTFRDPVAALREMSRACRSDGRVLLLEHGRSERGWIAALQDRWADAHERQMGCRWNREPRLLAEAAGLEPVETRRTFFGVFHLMELRPGPG